MREFVMYCEKGGWKITARANYERRVRDCNKILHLSRDYVKAKHIAAYNFGLRERNNYQRRRNYIRAELLNTGAFLTLESCWFSLKFHQKGVDNTPNGCIMYAKVNRGVKS